MNIIGKLIANWDQGLIELITRFVIFLPGPVTCTWICMAMTSGIQQCTLQVWHFIHRSEVIKIADHCCSGDNVWVGPVCGLQLWAPTSAVHSSGKERALCETSVHPSILLSRPFLTVTQSSPSILYTWDQPVNSCTWKKIHCSNCMLIALNIIRQGLFDLLMASYMLSFNRCVSLEGMSTSNCQKSMNQNAMFHRETICMKRRTLRADT